LFLKRIIWHARRLETEKEKKRQLGAINRLISLRRRKDRTTEKDGDLALLALSYGEKNFGGENYRKKTQKGQSLKKGGPCGRANVL